jgi:hypothetical protein
VRDLGRTDDVEILQEAAGVITWVSPMGGLIKGAGMGDLHVAMALAAKASSAKLRRQRKDECLQKKREAFARKTLQVSRSSKNSSRKRARKGILSTSTSRL